MYNDILTILLKIDPPKSNDTGFKHPFASLPVTPKRDMVISFCKKYPWAVSPDFLSKNKLDPITPVQCEKIEEYMIKGQTYLLYNELRNHLPADKYYPVNYWERLAVLLIPDDAKFVEIMFAHGYKFTEGVVLKLLSMTPLDVVTKRVILQKIKNDKDEMINSLMF